VDLNGAWDLAWCDPGQGEKIGWPNTGVGAAEHVTARVPGDVHMDLAEAGVIDEPLYGLNAPDCVWMEQKDWWYSRTFDLSADEIGDRVELVFHGLDTTADVWLNGRPVGRSNNMHVPHTFDVTGAARPGPNLLVVRVDAGIRAAAGKDAARYRMGSEETLPRAWVRKAQFTFEWDWAPRLLTCGIWRPVELRSHRRAALRDVCLRTHLREDGAARVDVLAEVENFTGAALDARVKVTLSRRASHATTIADTLDPGTRTLHGSVTVEQPELWWPAPLGEHALYDVAVVLLANDQELDRRHLRCGLREVTLVQEPIGDEGRSFAIAVNGEKVFCKGANWVPSDSIIARVSPARYGALVAAAAEANFNMFRVWGGGIYEDDLFYSLCDEHGILVWQEFLYACSYYPDEDAEFVAEARREAEKAVRRLRNYACLALWCGNNENQWLHQGASAGGGAPERCLGDRLYDQVLPEVCARLDPTRPYWPGSPYGGQDANSELEGDRHSWSVSIGAPTLEERIDYRRYAEDRGKFVSEFGVLAPPPLDSLRRYLPPRELRRGSKSWAFHNNKFEKGTNQEALKRYWQPADEMSLAEYLRASQTIQAEALKFALEHWRRRKFSTAGALFWMYADCWGEVGWTIVDYYLNRKPSYYAVRRAFAPVLASLQEGPDGVTVWLVNDGRAPVPGELRCGWVNVRTGEMTEQVVQAEAPANGAAQVERLPFPAGDREAWMAYARFTGGGKLLSSNRHFLAGFQFNRLGLPAVRVRKRIVEGGKALEVATDGFAWQVHLDAPRGIHVEDNDFDLLPGEARRVRVHGPREMVKRIHVSALNAALKR
jgi:beta-mannosidase